VTARSGRDLERAGPRLEALADPTRRALLGQIAEHGPISATRLAEGMPISRQAVAKHLSQLESAGLVASARSGREARYDACPDALRDLAGWLAAASDAWDRRLDRLAVRARARAEGRGS
jgi:DNA-binding transcriptional ArsR family regulator